VIRHLLLDADGVLQTIPGGGQVGRARPYLGDRAPEVVERLFVAEQPALRGESDFEVDLRALVERDAIDVDADELYAQLWGVIEVVPDMVDLVHRARAAGYGVHLGSNQHRQRAAYLRTTLGYDELFDVSCYSYELGAVKPDPAYFERAVERIGVDPATVLFVDDLADNVEGARATGLRAERWDLGLGLPALMELLAGHGVAL
jgi:putative hydrolase of the HAD superfamily